MTVSLITGNDAPDQSNVACQLEVNFQPNSNEEYDQIFIKTIENGRDEILNSNSPATGYFNGDGMSFRYILFIFIVGELRMSHQIFTRFMWIIR